MPGCNPGRGRCPWCSVASAGPATATNPALSQVVMGWEVAVTVAATVQQAQVAVEIAPLVAAAKELAAPVAAGWQETAAVAVVRFVALARAAVVVAALARVAVQVTAAPVRG